MTPARRRYIYPCALLQATFTNSRTRTLARLAFSADSTCCLPSCGEWSLLKTGRTAGFQIQRTTGVFVDDERRLGYTFCISKYMW